MSFDFYHLVPKGSRSLRTLGIITPGYAYRNGDITLFRNMTSKYRDRIVGAWGIYPGRTPESLTDKEIVDAINKFRGSVYGIDTVYMFRYLPYPELGRNMADTLKGKDVCRIDMDSGIVRSHIRSVYWGHDMSYTGNKELDEEYYRNVGKDEYFSRYDDDAPMRFASLNHIGVVLKGGRLPPQCFEIIA